MKTRDLAILTSELFDVVDELCAREHGCNSVYEKYRQVSWEELCDKGMELLEELKVS